MWRDLQLQCKAVVVDVKRNVAAETNIIQLPRNLQHLKSIRHYMTFTISYFQSPPPRLSFSLCLQLYPIHCHSLLPRTLLEDITKRTECKTRNNCTVMFPNSKIPSYFFNISPVLRRCLIIPFWFLCGGFHHFHGGSKLLHIFPSLKRATYVFGITAKINDMINPLTTHESRHDRYRLLRQGATHGHGKCLSRSRALVIMCTWSTGPTSKPPVFKICPVTPQSRPTPQEPPGCFGKAR
ncbi:hypothetical protein IWX50DRAFT_362603 [Phyllosticta citricarpa]